MNIKTRFIVFFGISIMLHGVFISQFSLEFFFSQADSSHNSTRAPIEIQKYRKNIGDPNSTGINKISPLMAQQILKNFNTKSFKKSIGQNKKPLKNPPGEKRNKIQLAKKSLWDAFEKKKEFSNQKAQNETLGNSALRNSHLSVSLELPKGKTLDDLNEEELAFYSFKSRTIKTYIGSIFRMYSNYQVVKPHVAKRMFTSGTSRKMTARVTFSKDGDVKSIDVLEYDADEQVQNFFIKTLESIKIPNPPQMILDGNGQFNYYLALILKG